MTDILDFTSGDDQSLLILLGQCDHVRELLLRRIQQELENLSNEVLPLMTASSRLLNQAAQTSWGPEHLDLALQQVTSLESMCASIERQIRSYQSILAQGTTPSVLS